MTKPSSGDRRWPATIILTFAGAIIVLATWAMRGDSLAEFASTAAYSIGWALLAFGVLYLVSKQFENWEWDRPEHDMVAKFNEALE